jgi:hypothetical protein
MAYIKIVNQSRTRLLFSDFNAGDNAKPYDTAWVDPGATGQLETGNFTSLSIGVQAQEGGRWIGGDPIEEPSVTPGRTFTITIGRVIV